MNSDEKTCPRCAETIKRAAVVCRYCGHEFGDPAPSAAPASPSESQGSTQSVSNPTDDNGLQIAKVVAVGLLLFLIIAVIAAISNGSGTPSTTTNLDDQMNATEAAAARALENASAAIGNADASVEASTTPATGWSVTTSPDEVRGKTIYYASATSENEVNFDFPYNGGSRLSITVRKHPEYGQDVVFRISDGQFVCGIDSCSGTINFGAGPERLRLNESDDGDSKVLFAANVASVINKLKTADKVIVELPFYQEGNRQFTFNTKGLVWPPKD